MYPHARQLAALTLVGSLAATACVFNDSGSLPREGPSIQTPAPSDALSPEAAPHSPLPSDGGDGGDADTPSADAQPDVALCGGVRPCLDNETCIAQMCLRRCRQDRDVRCAPNNAQCPDGTACGRIGGQHFCLPATGQDSESCDTVNRLCVPGLACFGAGNVCRKPCGIDLADNGVCPQYRPGTRCRTFDGRCYGCVNAGQM